MLPLQASVSDEEFLSSFIGEQHKNLNKHRPSYEFDKEKSLYIINTHTGEEKNLVFKTNGSFNPEAVKEFSYLLRDFREDKAIYMDPKLLDYLYALKVRLDTDRPFHVLSGYRTRKTNNYLRRRNHGVAKNSFHIIGKASDITLTNKSTKQIARVARSLKYGGVGQYNKSHFVHVDTGPVRHWYG
jgi:uncharacterized protein YcbK (DUF882 family)